MDALLERARLVVAAGPYDARLAEIADVHDAIWPAQAPICPTRLCRSILGKAYYSIKRWVEQQGVAGDAPHSSLLMNKTAARFKSDSTIYTPHGLGVAYSNHNLTDKAARYILANDPDAEKLFESLPPEATDEELAPEQAPVQESPAPAQPSIVTGVPADFDYNKLASAMLDELERREAVKRSEQAEQPEDSTPEQPALTASAGGASDTDEATDNTDETDETDSDTDASDDTDASHKPKALSRMNSADLHATHLAELGTEAPEGATNDEVRDAIKAHRAANPTA